MAVKPFKGPVPLGPNDPIYGRRNDIDALVNILLPDRIVLMCASSGAGKTSLLEAGLNRALNDPNTDIKHLGCMARMLLRGFQVLPKIRVNTPLPPHHGQPQSNRFTFSMLDSLEQACPEVKISPEDLTTIDLDQYFEQRAFLRDPAKPKLMVFDQFEELMHIDQRDVIAKRVFLSQLGCILNNPLYWAVFAMRSEYVTDFDAYLDLIPTGLCSRFTLQLLSQQGAYDAIHIPFTESGAKIEPAAVFKLVSDLSGQRDGRVNSEADLSSQPLIEPLHLQVVCDNIWSAGQGSGQTVSEKAIDDWGGVDKALEQYIAEQLRRFCELILSDRNGPPLSIKHIERTTRKWIESALISSEKTRNSIYEEDGRIFALCESLQRPKDLILPKLVDTYLIRRDVRNQRGLYELAHDRLVDLMLKDNHRWFSRNLAPVQVRAETWAGEKRPELLFSGEPLAKAKAWLERQPHGIETSIESAFVKASLTHEHELRQRERQKNTIKWLMGVLIAVLLLSVAYLYVSLNKTKMQKDQSALLMMTGNRFKSLVRSDPGVMFLLVLETYKAYEAHRSKYRRPNDPLWKHITDEVRVGVEFAAEFEKKGMGRFYRRALSAGTDVGETETPQSDLLFDAHPSSNHFALCRDRKTLEVYAYGSEGITMVVEQRPSELQGKVIRHVAFQPGTDRLVIFTTDAIHRFHSFNLARVGPSVPIPEPSTLTPVFDSTGRHLAVVSADGRLWLLKTDTWKIRELRTPAIAGPPLAALPLGLAFSPNADRIAVGYSGGAIGVWCTNNCRFVPFTNSPVPDPSGMGPIKESELVAIGFGAKRASLFAVYADAEAIRVWPAPLGEIEPQTVFLDKQSLYRADRQAELRRTFKPRPAGANLVGRTPTAFGPEEPPPPKVIAVAVARGVEQSELVISRDNGDVFIIREDDLYSGPPHASDPKRVTAAYAGFQRGIEKVYFSNSGDRANLIAVAKGGDVFVIDHATEDPHREARLVKDILKPEFDPAALETEICEKAWRNMSKKEWDTYVPGEPYACTCAAFGPGYDTGFEKCPRRN